MKVTFKTTIRNSPKHGNFTIVEGEEATVKSVDSLTGTIRVENSQKKELLLSLEVYKTFVNKNTVWSSPEE